MGQTDFNTRLKALITKKKIPGCAWAILDHGESLVEDAAGYANLEANIPATIDTPFLTASLSKTIAATIVMFLVEKDLINLDTHIGNYIINYADLCNRIHAMATSAPNLSHLFSEYPCHNQAISLRHHLTHTAQSIPGKHFFYNGFLYGIVARAIHDKTDKSASEWLRECIIIPLQLTHMAPRHNDKLLWNIETPMACVYKHVEGKHQLTTYPQTHFDRGFGAGIVSSIHDLAQFDRALDQGKIINDASKQLMWQPNRLSDGTLSPYGIGWFVQPSDYGRLIWHSGWWPGAASALYLKIPDKRLSFIIVANSEDIWWGNPPDKGDVLRSEFAQLFLQSFAI